MPNRPAAGTVKTGNRTDFLKGIASASAFPTPALGSQGNGGRNTYIGPGMASVNTQFAKEFTLERFKLEFRADVFNLFQPGQPYPTRQRSLERHIWTFHGTEPSALRAIRPAPELLTETLSGGQVADPAT